MSSTLSSLELVRFPPCVYSQLFIASLFRRPWSIFATSSRLVYAGSRRVLRHHEGALRWNFH